MSLTDYNAVTVAIRNDTGTWNMKVNCCKQSTRVSIQVKRYGVGWRSQNFGSPWTGSVDASLETRPNPTLSGLPWWMLSLYVKLYG